MQCPINALRDARTILENSHKSIQGREQEVTSDGSSLKLQQDFLQDLVKKIRDPEGVLTRLAERTSAMNYRFHKALKREMGEELYLTSRKSPEKYYVLGSELNRDSETGDIKVTLKMAPESNIGAVEPYTFGLLSDTVYEGFRSEAKTFDGISYLLQKAVRSYIAQEERIDGISKVEGTLGDPVVKGTLEKMTQVDTILQSKQTRTPDDLVGYEVVQNYEHGDINSMKETLNKLHVLGRSKAPTELLAYYNQLLDKMHPRFFNELKLYLKRNGTETTGFVNLNQNTMAIEVAAKRNDAKVWQSEAEVYIHEVVHSITAWALRQTHSSTAKLKLQLNHAMSVAKSQSTWKDFLLVPLDVATEREIELAKSIQETIFSGENNVDEFITYVLTNPMVMKKMQTIKMDATKDAPETLFERIVHVMSKIWDTILGRYNFKDADLTVFDQVNNLAFQLAEINANYHEELKTMNPIGQIMNVYNNADGFLAKKIRNLRSKLIKENVKIKIPAEGEKNPFVWAKFLLDVTLKGFFSPIHRKAFGMVASAWHLKPDSSTREVLRGFMEKSEEFRAAEKINMSANQVDVIRNNAITAGSQAVLDAFKVRPTVAEEEALTTVLIETGLVELRYNKGSIKKKADKDIINLLLDDDYSKTREGRVKHAILERIGKDEKRGRWTVTQAIALGYWKATGNAFEGMLFNADNIVKGYGTLERYEYDATLSSLVNELSTIYAVRNTKKADRKLVARLIKEENEAVNLITDDYQAYMRNATEELFNGDTTHMMAGYVKEIMDDTIDVRIAPISKQQELREEGFTLVNKLTPAEGDLYEEPMGYFMTSSWGKNERLRGTVGLGKLHTKGTTMSSLKMTANPSTGKDAFQRDFAKMQRKTMEIHEAMREGTFDLTKVKHGLAPVYDRTGRITDYRYMMDKKSKKTLLKQDLRVSQVLPRSAASVEHHVQREKVNAEALRIILDDMKENWESGEIGKDGLSEFALIGPNVTDPQMRELYIMLPQSYREVIENRADKTLAVRKELVPIYFGYSHLKLTDLPLLRNLPTAIKTAIDITEGIWMELIKISKGAILLKMPAVLAFNMLSNILYQISTLSVNPVQLARDYKDSVREVNEYLTYNRKITRLTQEIARDKEALRRVRNSKALSEKIREKTVELERMEAALVANPAKELFDTGMYQTHVEEIENSALNETNKIAKAINDRLSKTPTIVQKVANWTYLTQNTWWYQMSQEVLQRSDMISRNVENKMRIREENKMANGEKDLPEWWHKLQAKKDPLYTPRDRKVLKGDERLEFFTTGRDMRMRSLIDNYVNYTLPNGRIEEYLNRIGVFMFTKYLKRIQPVIANSFINHPLKTSLTFLGVNAMADVDMIQDSALFVRAFDYRGDFGFSNIVPIFSPLYHLENVFTPAIVKAESPLGFMF